MHLRVKWVEIAHVINESGREPKFSDLARFVDEKSRVANSMYGIDIVKENRTLKVEHKTTSGRFYAEKPSKDITTLTTQSNTEMKKYERKCRCCHGNCADLCSCVKFKSMNLKERNEVVKKNKLCFNCLKGNHSFNNCRKPKLCTVPDCRIKHNILLHSWTGPRNEASVTQSSVNCAAVKSSFVKNCLGVVPVIVRGENGIQCHTYALLDDGADKTLCDERLLQKLNVDCKPITFQISTVNSSSSTSYGHEADLTVMAVNGTGSEEVSLRKVWSVKKLPISAKSAAMHLDYKTFPYLSDIEIPQIPNTDVMLLIGTDFPAAHIPLEVRSGDSDQPYAVRSRLGWAIRGPLKDDTAPSAVNIHFEQSRDILLQEQLEKMWNTDFKDRLNEKNSMSLEDKSAMKIMESSLIHKDGHYMMGLPWKNENGQLPNNIPLAQVRLQQLRNKLSRDPGLQKMYTTTMNEYIEKGFATELPELEDENYHKRIWYLPHHPVTNVNKPGKVRIVFDCAAKYKGVSLNSQLLQGPDLMNSLMGVVIRFRKEKIALAADIESMFHQVRVTDEDRNVLRFLWWPGGDLNKKPKCYRMNVHLFGATSSPSCAEYAIKRTAVDNAEIFEPEVVTTVQRNFYVDDCLKSVESEQKAIKLATDLQSIMKLGGFRLTKWLSNSREVLNAIPESERAPSVVNLSFDDTLPCDRALGVLWNVNEDKICFKVKLEKKPFTRRGILSVVSSIYDPLGLVSPVTLQAKGIVQSLCRLKIGWDDQIPHNISNEWQTWLSTLSSLEKLSVNRWYRPQGFGTVRNTQLHIFSDGSERGYGACAYLRFVDVHDNVHCSLVIGKSHLAPIKQMSIPRLELSGAVVGCRLFAMLSEELDMNFDQVTFWTDSMIVLGYINNVSKRFKTFVGNRLSIIHETTSPDQWRHVHTSSNPADIASRGISAYDTEKLHLWLNGPTFLQQDSEKWTKNPLPPEVAENDNEVKKEVLINKTSAAECLDSIIDRYSSWTKLRRAVAWLLRYKTFCRQRYLKHKLKMVDGNLTLEEIQTAEHNIMLYVQNTAFSSEINNLQNSKPVKKDSSIASLNPVIYDDLIRVQGRLQSRNPSKCPVILPNKNTVTRLIIRHNTTHT
ncbi:uncharacterized protein LOC132726393 [Ruditapes philippinarum]|uniref:uncharacterized protein LOC132726393 n=1 Tax=Ruditapes philippinarum TaxID=129788 RepID=UPI00295AD908|nr:uncharacterized protein LOC132726393 [Ruditapes philippinarum]